MSTLGSSILTGLHCWKDRGGKCVVMFNLWSYIAYVNVLAASSVICLGHIPFVYSG